MAKKSAQPPSFESALERLEATVRRLEGGDVPLEESLALFEEGVRLSRQCATRLDEAEQRVSVLMEDASGALSLEPLSAED